jgi:hypothetical protein
VSERKVEMTFAELELAFEFVNLGGRRRTVAYVSRSTGRTYVCSEASGIDELPDDVDENDDYVEIPHRNDLDLGQQLVWKFVELRIPELKSEVQEIFSDRGGAWSRYTELLAGHELLDDWHRFDDERTREALLEWCRDVGVAIEE